MRVFTNEQVGAFGACHYGAYSAARFDNLCLTIEDYNVWCKQKGVEPTPIKKWGNKVIGKNATITWNGLKLEVDSDIGFNNCKCIISNDGTYYDAADQEEVTMKALYRFYGLNRRTGAFLEKMVVATANESKALNIVLLDNAAEITLNLGNTEECQFCLMPVMTFEPIESED